LAKNKNLIPDQPRRVYGRRKGRPLNPARQKALDELLDQLRAPFPEKTEDKQSPHSFFSIPKDQIHMEIGFGDGEHLAARIRQSSSKNIGFIGAEPYMNGMAAFLKRVDDFSLPHDSIKIWMDDAIRLVETFEDNTLDLLYVLNPDPWPKLRHHKRRIINQKNLDLFARVLKPSATLIMTTDVTDLAEWMVTQATIHPAFEWTAQSREDWTIPPKDWISTRYEEKGRAAGRTELFLIFKKLND
jgi:tRNA (guanine-N7-)-methyltransferase